MAFALDDGQPHLGMAFRRLCAAAAGRQNPAMRAGADADIFAIPPIDEIVPALRARARVIGDFISGKTGFRRDLLRHVPQRAGAIGIREDELACIAQALEHRVWLDRELIEGKMIARAENRSLQFFPPAGYRLAWPRINQIEGIALEDGRG